MSADAVQGVPTYAAPRVEAGVVEKTVHLGDTFHYRIEVDHPGDVSVKLPTRIDLGELTLNGVDHASTPAKGKGGLVTETWTLKVGAYALDAKALPALNLDVVTADGPATLEVPATPVTLKTHVDDAQTAKARELAPPEEVWLPDYTLLKVGGAILGGVLLALLVWRWLRGRRLRRSARPVPPPPPRPLEVRTREALKALADEGLVAKGRKREYFFRLSEIVRAYLGERFGFDALECTSEELLAALRDRPTPGLSFEDFRRWTELGDLVKFAKVEPDDGECAGALTAAHGFVDRTTEAIRPAGDEGRAA